VQGTRKNHLEQQTPQAKHGSLDSSLTCMSYVIMVTSRSCGLRPGHDFIWHHIILSMVAWSPCIYRESFTFMGLSVGPE